MPGECFPGVEKISWYRRKGGGKNGTYSSPNDHSTRNFLDRFIGHLENDAFLLDFLDHGLGQDINLGFFEGRLGELDEGLAEHWQHGWKSLHERDLHPTGKLWVPELEILLQEIVKLAAVRGNQQRAWRGSRVGKTDLSSIPVGPPPTTTMWRRRSTSSGL